MKRKCKICGVEFEVRHGLQKYCGSAECHAEKKRRQMRAYYRRHAEQCRQRARQRYWSMSAAEYAAYLEYCKKWRRLNRDDNRGTERGA